MRVNVWSHELSPSLPSARPEEEWRKLESSWRLMKSSHDAPETSPKNQDEEEAVALMQRLLEERDEVAREAMRSQALAEAELEAERETFEERN